MSVCSRTHLDHIQVKCSVLVHHLANVLSTAQVTGGVDDDWQVRLPSVKVMAVIYVSIGQHWLPLTIFYQHQNVLGMELLNSIFF